jgi:hypothetical protein
MTGPLPRRAFLHATLGLCALPALSAARGQDAGTRAAHDRLDRLNLLLHRDADGRVRPVTTRAHWERRREAILRGAREVMGPLPDESRRVPLDVEVTDEVDGGSYVRRTLTYASEPGSRTPAHLLIPKRVLQRGGTARAVLCLHPTDDTIGHDVVVGLGGRPNRAYAAELAARGFVTLAPAYPMLARYQPDVLGLGYASGTMKAIWDNVRGLDLLETLPWVTPGPFGVIGHSLGGHNAVFTAAFDDRLGVVVSSCGLDLFIDYYDGNPEVWQRERGWCQVRYMPRLLEYAGRLEEIPFDFAELVAVLAPRVCFISAPLHDTNFRWKSVAHIAEAARPVYALLGHAGHLIVEHPDADHDFPEPQRETAYRLFERHLA